MQLFVFQPVYLKMSLDSDAGIVPCDCSSESSPCFGLSADARVLPLQWPKSCNELSSKLDHAAVSSMLLATHCTTVSPVAVVSDSHLLLPPTTHASFLHDPYTPESMETPSSSPTPSVTPQFELTFGCDRERDTYLSMYGSTESTKDKIYNWDFVMDSVDNLDDPDEDECADNKNGYSSYKRGDSRRNMRQDIQESQHFDSGQKNETVLLTEKLLSSRMVFAASGVEVMSVGNLNEKTDSVHTSCLYSQDEVKEGNLNNPKQFKVPDIFQNKCDSGSSLNKCPVLCNSSEKVVGSEKFAVSKEVCFCDTDVQINNNNNSNYNNEFTDQCLTASVRDTVQNTSQVKDNKISINIIPGLLSEAQDLLSLCQDNNDTDGQVLRQNMPAVLLETAQVEMERNVPWLCSGCSAVSNPTVIHVQSAVNIRSCNDRRPPNSFHEMQSFTSRCNSSVLLSHPVSHETSHPVSDPVITTDNQTTNESDSSDKIKFVLPIKNSFLVPEPTESSANHEINLCANCRKLTSVRLLSCDKVLELSRLVHADSALSKLSNDKVTTHDCSVKHLFRSASVPVGICSTRIIEKQIPYLLVMSRMHSCGDITLQSIQDASSASWGEKSALNQQPYTEQNNSISSACSSFSKVPVSYKREMKDDQKVTDGQCFNCCILL
jgi:hypothetical protein